MSKGMLDVLHYDKHKEVIDGIERFGAERNVLAYIISDPDSIFDVSIRLNENDFANSVNQKIYSNMIHLMNSGNKVSTTTVVAMLKAQDVVSMEQAEDYLEIVSKTNTRNLDLEYNIEMVKSASIRRELYKESLGIIRDCVNENYDESVEAFIGRQQQRLLDVQIRSDSANKAVNIDDIIAQVIEESSSNPKEIVGLKTGFEALDKEILGLRNGMLYIVGARSKTGKSITLLNWMANIAIEQKKPALYIDTEMSSTEVATRLLSRESYVPEKKIVSGMFSQYEDQVALIKEAQERLRGTEFYHVYLPDFTPEQITSLSRMYKIRYGIEALFFDYIKVPASDVGGSAKEYEKMGKTATMLKDLAGSLDIPVITAAQLNRSGLDAEDIDEGMIGGSDKLFQYCNYFFGLRNQTDKEREEIQDSAMWNQVLSVVGGRTFGTYTAWLHTNKSILRSEEYLPIKLSE